MELTKKEIKEAREKFKAGKFISLEKLKKLA